MKNSLLLLILLIISLLFSSCSKEAMKDISENIIDGGKRIIGKSNDSDKGGIIVNFALPNENNTHRLNERIELNNCGNEFAYTVKDARMYDGLEKAAIKADEINSIARIINIDESGEIVNGCKLVFISLDITALSIKNNENISVSDISIYADGFNEIEYTEAYSGERQDDRFISGLPRNDGPDYFSIKQNETITRSKNDSEYFHYSTNLNETAEICVGFIIREDIISNHTLLLRIGSDTDTVQYVKLFE